MDNALSNRLLRPSEVAELCGVDRNTVYRWLRRGVFTHVKIGGNTYVKGSELRTHLHGQTEPASDWISQEENELEREAREMLFSFRDHRGS